LAHQFHTVKFGWLDGLRGFSKNNSPRVRLPRLAEELIATQLPAVSLVDVDKVGVAFLVRDPSGVHPLPQRCKRPHARRNRRRAPKICINSFFRSATSHTLQILPFLKKNVWLADYF
jgi:hypothetical protein